MALCTVTGTVYTPGGQVARGRDLAVSAVPARFDIDGANSVVMGDTFAATDSNGGVVLVLYTGRYRIMDDFGAVGVIDVPDATTAVLADILL